RAGGFEPLRFVPRGKMVVLGLVTTKEPRLESQDELRRRIDEAANYVPLEDLALSPQCGFASIAAGNLLSPDDHRRKLGVVVAAAGRVWGWAPPPGAGEARTAAPRPAVERWKRGRMHATRDVPRFLAALGLSIAAALGACTPAPGAAPSAAPAPPAR